MELSSSAGGQAVWRPELCLCGCYLCGPRVIFHLLSSHWNVWLSEGLTDVVVQIENDCKVACEKRTLTAACVCVESSEAVARLPPPNVTQ